MSSEKKIENNNIGKIIIIITLIIITIINHSAQGVPLRFEDDPTVPGCKLQLSPGVLALLRARYYEFDDAVMRSFLGGRKLTTKQVTKELAEVAQKTRVSFRSCRR